ncbi:transposase [Flaviaesturariibacter amylovorans]|uniref:Transposase n=1 Tax=Flaviaesturariibacter amylovorans TaxID=1084520 RepID=A0ABP8GAY1_9BACT
MKKPYEDFRRVTTRLAGYDYAQDGTYFVTLCTQHRQRTLGILRNGSLAPSEIGKVAIRNWESIPDRFPFILLDTFQLMPDHLHAILSIDRSRSGVRLLQEVRPGLLDRSQTNRFGPQRQNLPCVIGAFKASVKNYANKTGIPFAWQPRYHEHIIRDAQALDNIRAYIRNNPLKG